MAYAAASPVIAGLTVGIGFIVIFALIMYNAMHFMTPPVMYLILTTGNESQTYETFDNAFCGKEQCDFLLFARVLPSSPDIPLDDKSPQMAFKTGHLGQRQPDRISFVIQKLEKDGNHNGDMQFIDTDLQLQKIGEGRYLIGKGWPSGKYILDVIASWENNDNPNQQASSYSLHRFNLIMR